MQTIIDYYNQVLSLIPDAYRLPLSIIIIVILVLALVKFLRKNLIWIVLFLLLLPAAYPAIRQIGISVWGFIQKIPK